MYSKILKWILIVIGIFLILFTLFAYIYKFGSFTFSENKADWGTFGDYLGGVLGTILALITIYLLYETYKTQNSQLRVQTHDSIINYLDLQYNQIIKDISDLSFGDKKGSDALYAWNTSHTQAPNNIVNTLNFIVHTFNIHIETIRLSDVELKVKESFFSRAYLMFHSKIIWPVLDKLYDDKAFKEHTDNLYSNFNILMKDTYEHLVPKKQLLKPKDIRILEFYKSS